MIAVRGRCNCRPENHGQSSNGNWDLELSIRLAVASARVGNLDSDNTGESSINALRMFYRTADEGSARFQPRPLASAMSTYYSYPQLHDYFENEIGSDFDATCRIDEVK